MTLRELKAMKRGTPYYFKGLEFYHVGWEGDGMPMCSKQQYESFSISYAYIRKDAISQYGVKIGTIHDLKKTKEER